ncbi:MAG TPA: SUMF1/EgtB/PvdO family nonheme iron enzyme [Polyangiaceae bacterium]|nr:SUMF1/EgtB/PvdO family nonheme iron enzyme [Polyangiaceae bacterium]
MRLSQLLTVFLLSCAASKPAPSIDREPAPRVNEALPADATHKAETAPKRETTPTSPSHLGKDPPKDATKDATKDAAKDVAKVPAPEAQQEPAKDAGEAACPAGMKLVDGDYCTDVDYECKKSWYDKSNKKTVCEEFEPKSTCKGEKVHKRYCMDTYTWPNEKGARPEVMNRFHQAEVKCAAVGKRMCTESEWTLACEGPKMLPFPYGYVRDTNKCLGDVEWDAPNMKKVAARDPEELARLWKGVRNGSQPECISAYGIADLPGNTDEVVSSETYSEDFRGKFDSVHSGGPWYKGVRNQCRPKIYTHDEGFYYYFLGFRCCAEADDKPTDPRTPKQIKGKWGFERVERQAGFTKAEMIEKLKLKEQGKCTCGAKDIRCKTMCGTLLGPEAKDYR